MSKILVRQLSKAFPQNTNDSVNNLITVFDKLDLDVSEGEFVSFFGPNGCGKTTFLSAVAGLLDVDDGEVEILNHHSNTPRVGIIFQNYRESLFPWLTNIDNVAFPLDIHGTSKQDRRHKAKLLLEKLGIEIPLQGYPYQLSGGQQQLLSIARALVFEVDVLLMDEPFGSLDYSTRFFIRDRVQDIWMKTKTTTMLISHSIEEAIYLADRLILFSKKPMKIVYEISVELPRPRTPEILEDEHFFSIHSEALRIFKEEITR